MLFVAFVIVVCCFCLLLFSACFVVVGVDVAVVAVVAVVVVVARTGFRGGFCQLCQEAGHFQPVTDALDGSFPLAYLD